MQCRTLIAVLLAVPTLANAQVTFSRTRPPVIVTAPDATPQEVLAADELSRHLGRMLGVACLLSRSKIPAERTIVVGLASKWKDLSGPIQLGEEGVALVTKGNRLLVLGGGPRGTIYAVNRLLHRQGVRWWTPWSTNVPTKASVRFAGLNVIEHPTFESRSPFWFHAFDREWSRRNNSNGQHHALTAEDGGKITYQGFVHTFYPLVPPEQHFQTHPEWYSLIGGKRRVEGGQLCTTNPELRDFIVSRVREDLRRDPSVRIVSVSQNDWYGWCECDKCKALDEAEGSHAATVLDLANYVADKIGPEFPDVAIDTLAYQYTRQAPKTLKPRPNVIVRLCSIECDFSKPLTAPSNASFAKDIRDWSRLTNRLYVWNYVTDFPNYMMPFPNWFVLGPNERFFAENGVMGLFEQGAYQSHGSSMAPMQAWVQAQLLWNPHQDDKALIREFLRGYYGAADKAIWSYLNLLAKAAEPHRMEIWAGPGAPFFDAKTVIASERLWQKAEKAVAKDPDLLWRVRIEHLSLRYVFLSRWNQLRAQAAREKLVWPVSESRKAVADDWIRLATGPGPEKWSPVTHLSESGLRPENWIERFAVDPEPITLPDRKISPSLPSDLPSAPGARVLSIQDDEASLFAEGDMSELRPDPAASDKIACRLPGTHHEWAFQLRADKMPAEALSGTWHVYVVARVEPGSDSNRTAFTAGVYSADQNQGLGQIQIANTNLPTGYRTYLLATTPLTRGCYVWVAPSDDGCKAVWIDRVILVRSK